MVRMFMIMVSLQGYTPLHIAMQFRHENLYRLLVEAYGKCGRHNRNTFAKNFDVAVNV